MSRLLTGSRRTRSLSPDENMDSDYLAALKLSMELNGESLPLNSGPSQADYEADADFAYALSLQFDYSNDVHPTKIEAHVSDYASLRGGGNAQLATWTWALDEQAPKVADYPLENSIDETFDTLEEFIRHVRSSKCPGCGHIFFASNSYAIGLLNSWEMGKEPLTSLLKCTECSRSSCLTCTPGSSTKWSVVSVQGKQISWCCVGGRLLLLWLLLCGIDKHFSATKSGESNVTEKTPRLGPPKKRQATQRGQAKGIGFGGDHLGDMSSYLSGLHDYEEDERESNFVNVGLFVPPRFARRDTKSDSKAKALKVQQAEDDFYGLNLQLVDGLLPSFERQTIFDFDPPMALMEMLVESKILNLSAELLRNDYLQDVTNRKKLYEALFDLLRTLGSHYATSSGAICNKRPLREDKVNLLVLSFQEIPKVSTEYSCSILDSLNNLNTQSELLLKEAKHKEEEFRTAEGQSLLSLCRQITDLRGYLMANSGTKGKAKAIPTKPEVPAMIDLPDHEVMKSHAFASRANSTVSAPGRFKRIITEITTLKTGLPPGIFVRYAESRPDIMKVVIIGPQGTPYENGIFEFDIFCDGNFPNMPPQVLFKTTGGNRINFNPNLYADGKVCLSLLGTWQGEPWVPKESTLLQVVVSIQAMILCEEPWFNEPGNTYANHLNSKNGGPSATYNQRVRQDTIDVAILGWLNQPPQSLWKAVMDQHFTANADIILHTAVDWSKSKTKENSSFAAGVLGTTPDFGSYMMSGPTRYYGGHSGDVWTPLLQKLQEALRCYGASQIVPKISEPVKQESLRPPPAHRRPTNQNSAYGTTMSVNPYATNPPLPSTPQALPWLPRFDVFTTEDEITAVGNPAGLPLDLVDLALRGRGGSSFNPSFTRGRGGSNTSSHLFSNNYSNRGNVLWSTRGGFLTGRGRGVIPAPSQHPRPLLPPGPPAGRGDRGGRGGLPNQTIGRGHGDRGGYGSRGDHGGRGGRGRG